MNWRAIRLELGSTRDFPAGSVSRAYLIRVPLDDSDIVDGTALARSAKTATVQRHWSTEADQHGILVSSGSDWTIRCDGGCDRLLHLDGTPMRLGQQVSMVEPDGTVLPFKVASVR